MIVGTGVDVVSVARIEAAMDNPRFLERILTAKERALGLSPARVAGRWAAKEAISKALGMRPGWHRIEVLNDPTGAPRAEVAVLGDQVLHLSISHERAYAVAIAVVEAPKR